MGDDATVENTLCRFSFSQVTNAPSTPIKSEIRSTELERFRAPAGGESVFVRTQSVIPQGVFQAFLGRLTGDTLNCASHVAPSTGYSLSHAGNTPVPQKPLR